MANYPSKADEEGVNDFGPSRFPRAGETKVGGYRRLEERSGNPAQRQMGMSDLQVAQRDEDSLNFVDSIVAGLDLIDNPRAGVVNYAHAYMKTGDHKFAAEEAKKGYENNEHPLVGDILHNYFQDVRQGLIPAEDVSWFIKQISDSVDASDSISFLGGIIGDVAADPVSYMSLPLKGTKMAIGGVHSLGKVIARTILTPEQYYSAAMNVKRVADMSTAALTGAKDFAYAQTIDRVRRATNPLGPEYNKVRQLYFDKMHHVGQVSIGEARDLNRIVTQSYNQLHKRYPKLTRQEFDTYMTQAVELGVENISGANPELMKDLANNELFQKSGKIIAQRNADRINREILVGESVAHLGTGWAEKAAKWNVALEEARQRTLDPKSPAMVKLIDKDGVVKEYTQEAFEKKVNKANAIVDRYETMNYINHAQTEEAKEFFKSQSLSNPKAKFKIGGGVGFTITRNKKFAGKTVDEINKLSMKGKGPLGPDFKGKLLIDDPVHLDTLRNQAHYKSQAQMQMKNSLSEFDEVYTGDKLLELANKDRKGNPITDPKEAASILQKAGLLDGYAMPRNPLFNDMLVPSEMAKNLDDVMEHGAQTIWGANTPIVKQYDTILRHWKNWTLAPFPQYHWNNLIGNTWNIFAMRGVRGLDPRAYTVGMGIASDLKRGAITDKVGRFLNGVGAKMPEFIKAEDGSLLKVADLKQELLSGNELGVWGKGFIATETQDSMDKMLGKWSRFDKLQAPVRIGRDFGEFYENSQRAGLYVNFRQSGLGPADAAAKVRKVLFDYDDITDTEKAVMKRLFPFYTFTRKNLPYQAEMMLTHPERFRAAQFTLAESNAIDDRAQEQHIEQFKFVPQWMAATMPNITDIDEQGNVTVHLMGNALPYSDLYRMANTGKWLKDMTSPLIKGPLNYAYNMNPFTGEQMTEAEAKAPIVVTPWGDTVTRKTADLMRNIRVLTELDAMGKAYNPKAYNTIQGELSRNMPDPNTPSGERLRHWFFQFMTPMNSYNINLNDSEMYDDFGVDKTVRDVKTVSNKSLDNLPLDPKIAREMEKAVDKNQDKQEDKLYGFDRPNRKREKARVPTKKNGKYIWPKSGGF